MPELLTVGHGTLPADGFARLLHAAGAESVVDIRIAPGSRRSPHFGRDELAVWLPASGIAYRWERRLGGYRRLPPGSPDVALRNDSFRAYASHMRGSQFTEAMAELVADVAVRHNAVMCSESVWWRCHRRLVADHASLVEGIGVRHLMPDGRLVPHRPTSGVRQAGGELFYDLAGPAAE